MRILIAGAYGFIGAHIAARLESDGHAVRAAGRDIAWARKRFPRWDWVFADFSKAVDWAAHLQGVDAVVNCVGVLQDGGRDSSAAAHAAGAAALFAACERAGVRRIVHLSAIGIDADTPYARTKREGEAALMRRDLDWSILRPSLVIARGAYGGTALVRGIAGVPFLTLLTPSRACFRPIPMADLCEAAARLLKPDAPTRMIIDAAGPQEATLRELVAAHRQWLGFGPARVWTAPEALARAAFAIGDALGALGIRSALRSTARAQMEHNVGGDPEHLPRRLGFAAQPYEKALFAEPASVQDRWGARLYFVRPLAIAALAAFWIGTGIVCLTTGRAEAIALAQAAGLGDLSAPAADWGGAFDVAIGLALLLSRRTKLVLAAMAGVTIGYLAALSFLLPWLWADPLGRLMKLIPFFSLLALLAATADER
ncbi:MAG: SDR family oxidoreductase [Hyphomonadaceae bacterium]|nr:SDR family oxidoreductase [Hyphomonadaceae bacterium]